MKTSACLRFPFMQLKFKLARHLFQIQLVLEGLFGGFLIKRASHVIKPLYQGQQPGCLFFEANFVTSFICQHSLFTVFSFLYTSDRQNSELFLQLGEKQINIQTVCFSLDLGKLGIDLQIHSSALFVSTQEDFSNNKNITRDNRHSSVLLLFFYTRGHQL